MNMLKNNNLSLQLLCYRIEKLEQFAGEVEKALDAASNDVSQHLHDPVNAFQLTNRDTTGWMKLHDVVYKDNSGSK